MNFVHCQKQPECHQYHYPVAIRIWDHRAPSQIKIWLKQEVAEVF